MRLRKKLRVNYSVEEVTRFFYDPSSLAKWDRSVAEMIPGSKTGIMSGSTFDTVAPSGLRMNYEVIELDEKRNVKIKLNNSKIFKTAVWHFIFDSIDETTDITCSVYFKLRLPYIFLYPVLYFNRSAL